MTVFVLACSEWCDVIVNNASEDSDARKQPLRPGTAVADWNLDVSMLVSTEFYRAKLRTYDGVSLDPRPAGTQLEVSRRRRLQQRILLADSQQ